MGTTSAACSKSVIACRNPAACRREAALYQELSLDSGRTTTLDSRMTLTVVRRGVVTPVSWRDAATGGTRRVRLAAMSRGTAPRVLTVVAVVTLLAALVGFITTMVLNAFVLDEYDAYGEVPIPGSSSLHLPEGEVIVSFHTIIIGSGDGAPARSCDVDSHHTARRCARPGADRGHRRHDDSQQRRPGAGVDRAGRRRGHLRHLHGRQRQCLPGTAAGVRSWQPVRLPAGRVRRGVRHRTRRPARRPGLGGEGGES